MGAGASTGLTAAISSVTTRELSDALAKLDANSIAKLRALVDVPVPSRVAADVKEIEKVAQGKTLDLHLSEDQFLQIMRTMTLGRHAETQAAEAEGEMHLPGAVGEEAQVRHGRQRRKSRDLQEQLGNQLQLVFRTIDLDGNGTLDHDELKIAFHAVQMPISDDEISALIKEVDSDGDGALNFEEFKQYMWKKSLQSPRSVSQSTGE